MSNHYAVGLLVEQHHAQLRSRIASLASPGSGSRVSLAGGSG